MVPALRMIGATDLFPIVMLPVALSPTVAVPVVEADSTAVPEKVFLVAISVGIPSCGVSAMAMPICLVIFCGVK